MFRTVGAKLIAAVTVVAMAMGWSAVASADVIAQAPPPGDDAGAPPPGDRGAPSDDYGQRGFPEPDEDEEDDEDEDDPWEQQDDPWDRDDAGADPW